MELPIIYEDDDIITVNKPAGLLVHAARSGDARPSVSLWAAERFPHIQGVGEKLVLPDGSAIERSGVVHRLDRDTSGVLLLAKNQKAFEHLKAQFQGRMITKIYHAVVQGKMKERDGVIDAPIGRSRGDVRKKSTDKHATGKIREARTLYKRLAANDEFSFVEAQPLTGRTHQIRAHLQSIGHPIVCDALYAPKKICPNPPGRLALHARAVEFTTLSGTRLRLEAPLPEELASFVDSQFPEFNKLSQ